MLTDIFYFSPNLFHKRSENIEGTTSQWTYYDSAILNPVEIDTSDYSTAEIKYPEIESEIQSRITSFFENNLIHPSPKKTKLESKYRSLRLRNLSKGKKFNHYCKTPNIFIVVSS